MGLDFVEVLIAVEEEFQIDLLEEDAQKLKTIGELTDLVESRVNKSPVSEAEAEQYRLEGYRQATDYLSRTRSVDIASINGETKLETLFPLKTRNEDWKKMQDEFPNRIPNLIWSGGCIVGSLILAAFLIFLFGLVFELNLFGVLGVGLLLVGITIFYAVRSKATEIPFRIQTVDELARCLVNDRVRLAPNGKPWTRKMISKSIIMIFSEQLGIKLEELSDETLFSEMGLD